MQLQEEFVKEIIDLPDPDRTMTKDRKYLREKQESSSFNEEHYTADFVQKDQIEPYISYEPNYINFVESEIEFNDTEKDLLKELPNKEYLLDESEIYYALFNMVDILFAYSYDHRTILGENTVESGWTINKLSSTLCWFEVSCILLLVNYEKSKLTFFFKEIYKFRRCSNKLY